MRAHLEQIWISMRASYWFWPSVMALGAMLLAGLTIEVDARLESDWVEKLPFVYSNQPDGARALLSTVAGSMITVTGITFSLTLLAVSHATSQFGPRLLTNFMRDRGNQLTLGTFIATFLYCLLVLRTVRSAEEATGSGQPTNDALGAFVPHVSIFTALVLTIASVGVLIYFIHHIPESIRLSNVVADVGRELNRAIADLFPEKVAQDSTDADVDDPRLQMPDHFEELAVKIPSAGDGYVQTVDDVGLLDFAKEHELLIEMRAVPGDFVSVGQTLLLVESKSEASIEQARETLQFMFALGGHRTSTQNALFLVDQLVEVAARALSPGVNDPMTANTCVDWLQSALIRLANRRDPGRYRLDEYNNLRLIASGATFRDFCSRTFDQLRPYVAEDRNAALHMMQMIANVIERVTNDNDRQILADHASHLFADCKASGMSNTDIELLSAIHDHCSA